MAVDENLNLNLSPQQFYHGSLGEITGDVEPRSSWAYKNKAFFTPNKDLARVYAGQGGNVYHVSPTGPYEEDPGAPSDEPGTHFQTSHALKVTGREGVPDSFWEN